MYIPTYSPIPQETIANTSSHSLPDRFTLLTWNLQKVDFSHYINRPIENLIDIESPHLLSLQEAAIQVQQPRFFNLPFVMAPNIQNYNKHFGVLTASQHHCTAQHQCLTRTRELGFTTHKTALITEHNLANGQILTHVNIHAINFVPHMYFKKELNLLWNHLSHRNGPMIISGDFNTWNQTRLKTLLQVTSQLQLHPVSYPDNRAIKTMLRQPLDHIFYRGLKLIKSEALSIPRISDHNPLIAQFQQMPN
ncbi:MAG: endonuclease/exonuclease/phosphatase family protein [Pseudomonadota bacterium]